MLRFATLAPLALLLLASTAQAQQAVVTSPNWNNSGNNSSSIADGSQFQQVWASQANPTSNGGGHRQGCLVINVSTHRQWVYFQPPGGTTPTAGNTATIKDLAIPLEAATAANAQGGYVSCATGAGGALQDTVWILGTTADKFFAARQ